MNHLRGPKWTEFQGRTIKGEDHLGIKNVAIVMADYLQPGITSITPRARYWSFYSWVLYDFIENHRERSSENFKRHLKKQEWFYIIANIAAADEDGQSTRNINGIDKGRLLWSSKGNEIPIHYDYVKHPQGGYGMAYSNVLKILGLTRQGDSSKNVQIDRLTSQGKELGKAFEKTIENTAFYRLYKDNENAVPREVLTEYGRLAALHRINQPESQDGSLLRKIFLPNERDNASAEYRYHSLMYYRWLMEEHGKEDFRGIGTWRRLMYDTYSVRGADEKQLPQSFLEVGKGWEIYHGRQMFTYSLESIWSYLLELLARKPYTYKGILDKVFSELRKREVDLEIKTQELLNTLPLKVEDREGFLLDMRKSTSDVLIKVYHPCILLLDVYLRFIDRDDFTTLHREFMDIGGRDHISLHVWEKKVNEYLSKPFKELLEYIMRYYILEQHQLVALNKVVGTGNDTYHFVENDGLLHYISSDKPAFNVFRVLQGVSILKDLGYIS